MSNFFNNIQTAIMIRASSYFLSKLTQYLIKPTLRMLLILSKMDEIMPRMQMRIMNISNILVLFLTILPPAHTTAKIICSNQPPNYWNSFLVKEGEVFISSMTLLASCSVSQRKSSLF
jgi:hypothetical protein